MTSPPAQEATERPLNGTADNATSTKRADGEKKSTVNKLLRAGHLAQIQMPWDGQSVRSPFFTDVPEQVALHQPDLDQNRPSDDPEHRSRLILPPHDQRVTAVAKKPSVPAKEQVTASFEQWQHAGSYKVREMATAPADIGRRGFSMHPRNLHLHQYENDKPALSSRDQDTADQNTAQKKTLLKNAKSSLLGAPELKSGDTNEDEVGGHDESGESDEDDVGGPDKMIDQQSATEVEGTHRREDTAGFQVNEQRKRKRGVDNEPAIDAGTDKKRRVSKRGVDNEPAIDAGTDKKRHVSKRRSITRPSLQRKAKQAAGTAQYGNSPGSEEDDEDVEEE